MCFLACFPGVHVSDDLLGCFDDICVRWEGWRKREGTWRDFAATRETR